MAPIKSTIGKSAGKFLNSFRDRDLSLNSTVRPPNRFISSFSATGGTKTSAPDGYTYHFFTYPNSSNFVVSSADKNVELLVIAGGGGAGSQHGGGGGAGALYNHTSYLVTPGTYTVTVGAGGAGAPSGPVPSGTNGGNTTFGSFTLLGGGAGGSMTDPGINGGSGGGGGMDTTPWPSGSHPSPNTPAGNASAPPNIPLSDPNLKVNNGASGTSYYQYASGGLGGGGGGAAGAGTKAPNGPGGQTPESRGGDDFLWTNLPAPVIPSLATALGTPTTFLGVPVASPIDYLRAFGGGGAGGSHVPWGVYNSGGRYPSNQGGGSLYRSGGMGGTGNSEQGYPGVNGRGGGGGGSGDGGQAGGLGGHGVVIIRYLT